MERFRYFLRDNGFRESTTETYIQRAVKYLEFAGTDKPTQDDLDRFRTVLHAKNLARNTINNFCIAARAYHTMRGEQVSFPFLKISDTIPNYFSQEDVLEIFGVVNNFKHYVMLQTIFYACLRASELCALNVEDVDLNGLTIMIREGKGGRDGISYINDQCARILKRYIQIKPDFEIEGQMSTPG